MGGEAMAKQICNAEQALTPKLIQTLAILCLVSVAVLTPAGALAATQPQRPQLQNIEPTQAPSRRVKPGKVPDGLSNGGWAMTQNEIQKLLASDGTFGNQYGISVAVDRDTALIGAAGYDLNEARLGNGP